MNTTLLLLGLRVWSASSSVALLTRLFLAISVFSVEMQFATWWGIGSIRTLIGPNLIVALLALWFWQPRASDAERPVIPFYRSVPSAAVVALTALVLILNVWNPLEAADPYNLERVERIGVNGTLAYDPDGDIKTNILSPVYELVLADLRQTPFIGPFLLRLHGILGLVLYLVGIGAFRELFRAGPGWPWAVMLAVPVVFHQFVLVKNDIFVGVPGMVSLAWVMTRSREADWSEITWISWLTGFAAAVKLTSLPLAVILAVSVIVGHRGRWRPTGALVLGGLLGALGGGLIFTLVENIRVYGVLMPAESIGDRYASLAALGVGLARFGMSLFDLGLLTRTWWPGRGGWGGTFGLPLIWAIAVLVSRYPHSPEARRALLIAVVYFALFAAGFPDADAAQRLALAPGLLLIGVAVHAVTNGEGLPRWLKVGWVPVLALSGAQITRSAALYLTTRW